MDELNFHRLFAFTPYKELTLSLARMSFAKDFTGTQNGDPYPILSRSEDACECVSGGCYRVTAGRILRHMAQFFPYATYELTATLATGGRAGFAFLLPNTQAEISFSQDHLYFRTEGEEIALPLPDQREERTLIVTCRPRAFDIYFREKGAIAHFTTLKAPTFAESHREKSFKRGDAALLAAGEVCVRAASLYLDSGISLADLRPIRYETGDVMYEGGKIFLTATVRMEEEGYQGVLSWVPGTAELALEGALFYDSGDGLWANDVAASILFHRKTGAWLLWVCSFAHDHILGHAAFTGDPRFGVNVIDITLMPRADEGDDRRSFLGFFGDEDPDFLYDEKGARWLFAVCRLIPNGGYRYLFFTSDDPFTGYRYLGEGDAGDETGGSFIHLDGGLAFACGNSFTERSDYRVYTESGRHAPKFDHPDFGFRGWGTIIPVEMGSRKRTFFLTFDRHGGSDYRWSYGTLYGFERL